MNFISKCSTFCNAFYMTVLGLTIPAYAVLYNVTGFKFDPTKEEVAWVAVVIGAFLVGLSYLTLNERERDLNSIY